ncbi:unnamed protein product, partial [Brassica rapa]
QLFRWQVYSTFKAIENRDQNEQHKWLVYWAAYGSFSLVEVFTDKLISWFPRLASTSHRRWSAKQIYNNHLRPFLTRHQAGLVYEQTVKVIRSHQGEIRFVRSMIVRILGSALFKCSRTNSFPACSEEDDNSAPAQVAALAPEAPLTAVDYPEMIPVVYKKKIYSDNMNGMEFGHVWIRCGRDVL